LLIELLDEGFSGIERGVFIDQERTDFVPPVLVGSQHIPGDVWMTSNDIGLLAGILVDVV
jgi:hypothetical protein